MLKTLKKRKDFQAASGGQRFSTPAFTLLRGGVRSNVNDSPIFDAPSPADSALSSLTLPDAASSNAVAGCPARVGMVGSAGDSQPSRVLFSDFRFGFTVSKKLGNAVVRNRVRRRLKAAVLEAMRQLYSSWPEGEVSESNTAYFASYPHDFVVLARVTAMTHPFEALRADFTRAIMRLLAQAGRDSALEKQRGAASAPRMHAALGKSPAHRLEGNKTE